MQLFDQRDFFVEAATQEAIDKLAAASRLVVFLGAGVPASVGLPTWESLLRTLLTERIEDKCKDWKDGDGQPAVSERLRGEVVETLLASSDLMSLGSLVRDHHPKDPELREALRSALYEQRQENSGTLRGANFLRAIVELIVARDANQLDT